MKLLTLLNKNQKALFACLMALAGFSFSVGIVNVADAQSIPRIPPHIGQKKAAPMIMLNMSRDHQLSYKAYNEYSDLDDDGVPETSYKNSIDYYGYFDNKKCYVYDAGNQRFNPASVTTNHYCTNQWSGNFLNWSSMTRMDVVRKILYGGYRSTDTAAETILERAYLPTDAHSFAKYYAGADLNQLIPVTAAQTEVSICNTTLGSAAGVNRLSHTNTNPPLIRVALGNFALWNSNERWQCYWSEEKGATNDNNPVVSGINAAANNPSRNTNGALISGVRGDFIARVKVCDPALLGGEEAKCKTYPNGNRKPTGLLHTYGEDDQAEFGLLTGSFQRNISGGVLRKNMGTFSDEVNIATNGTFTATQGMVYNLNRLRIYGYDYNDGTYIGFDGNCTYQLIGLTEGTCGSWGNPIGEMYLESLRYLAGKTANFDYGGAGSKDAELGLTRPAWVDPFNRPNTIQTKFGGKECRPVNIINFNASVSSYDHNQWAGYADLQTTGSVNALADSVGVNESLTGKLGFIGDNGTTNDGFCTAKAINTFSALRGLCPDAPTYSGSYIMTGAALTAHTSPIRNDLPLDPSPSAKGNFKVNTYGVALATAQPKVDIPIPSMPGKVVTIQPAYRLNKPGGGVGGGTLVDFRIVSQDTVAGTGKFLVQWEDSEQGGDYDQDVWGYIEYQVVANQIRVTTYTAGAATANPQGFGYIISGTQNNDGPHFHSGIIGFTFNDPAPPLSVTPATNINASGGCNNCQVKQVPTTATYNVVGAVASSLKDPLWYSAKYGGFTDANNDKKPDTDYTQTNFSTPAYKAANGEWDSKNTSGAASPDGIPDNYFFAVNPAQLERSLENAFKAVIGRSSNAAAISSSRIGLGSLVIDSSFNTDGSGEIYAKPILFANSGGVTTLTIDDANPLWKAHVEIKNQNPTTGRAIISSDGANGIPFKWTALTVGQKNSLNTLNGNLDTLGEKRLDYLRGDHIEENGVAAVAAATNFRRRNNASSTTGSTTDLLNWALGDTVNSTGWLMAPPAAPYFETEAVGYSAFRTSYASRKSVIFVGANDGMLHGIEASTGKELLAYVPNSLYSRLSALTDPGYILTSYVDGSPFSGDMYDSGVWRTVLFSSLGRGGQGLFALDVTDPSSYIETNANNLFKWEFTDADDADLGYMTNRPTSFTRSGLSKQIGKFNDGKFYALVGNGYLSDLSDAHTGSGSAILFAMPATKSGATWVANSNYRKIAVGVLGNGPANGLSVPVGVDIDANGTIDYAYAGDLKGNVWKFNLTSNDPNEWKVDFSGVPLYVAKDTLTGTGQPITSAIMVTPHPWGGWMTNFATGKSLVASDYPSTQKQTIYGIWDRSGTTLPGGVSLTSTGRSRLLQQSTTLDNDAVRKFTQNSISNDWNNYDGWYFDLPNTGEMSIDNPSAPGSGFVTFLSIYPKSTTCENNNLSVLMDFDILEGKAATTYKYEGTAGGVSTASVSSQYTGASDTAIVRIVNTECVGVNCKPPCSGADCPCVGPSCVKPCAKGSGRVDVLCSKTQTGRQYWREVLSNAK